jgi:hypothetical protein
VEGLRSCWARDAINASAVATAGVLALVLGDVEVDTTQDGASGSGLHGPNSEVHHMASQMQYTPQLDLQQLWALGVVVSKSRCLS